MAAHNTHSLHQLEVEVHGGGEQLLGVHLGGQVHHARLGGALSVAASSEENEGSRRETALSKVRRNTRLAWTYLPFREMVKHTNTKMTGKNAEKKETDRKKREREHRARA
jgi:hypothetical protein